ncbi:MAG: GntR family transcriptional regulator [Kiritimatiellae bacterium]|nr:GntR family transcriptional regulator [Kiritimatiellia bacterium]
MERNETYVLDSAAAETLTEQLTGNLRRAIANGVFKPGDKLPGVRQMAELCGTSVQVPIAAMKTLAAEGFVKARPRIGCVVLEENRKVWRGRVLIVHVGNHANYSQNAFVNEVSTLIESENWRVEHVFVPRKEGFGDYILESLRKKLTEKFDLVLLPAYDQPVIEMVKKSGISCMLIWGLPGTIRSRVDCIMLYSGMRKALMDFVGHCRTNGIRHIIQMSFDDAMPTDIRQLLPKVITVEDIIVRPEFSPLRVESFSRCAYDALVARLTDRRTRRPDLIYFNDDYLARGGFWALEKAGLRVPEDIKVVTLTNYGNAPFYPKTLTRIECNPYRNAATVARLALRFLRTRRFAGSVVEDVKYIRGETF